MYHIFKNKSGELQAVDTGNPRTRSEAESILRQYGWQPGQNHYGSCKETPQEAINEAVLNKCNFDANISNLEKRAKDLSQLLKEFL